MYFVLQSYWSLMTIFGHVNTLTAGQPVIIFQAPWSMQDIGTMAYDDYDDDYDEQDRYDDSEDLNDDEDDEEDTIPPPAHQSGEHSVEISMEIDASGKEVWHASDSLVPGSSSMGHSVEEAVEGVEDRRREYREMLKRSRDEKDQRAEEE